MKKLILTFLAFTFIVLNISAQQKKVLAEEFTTTRCGFCPQKSIDLDLFAEQHPNVIPVTHHSGFGVDGMTNPTNQAMSKAFYPFSAPSMTIDRIKFAGQNKVGVSMKAFNYEDTILAILSLNNPVVTIDIKKNWNSSTREISGSIDIKFLTTPLTGDLRINLFIVEDSVIGDTGDLQYDQKNYITNDANYPLLYGKSLIEGYPHKNVIRAAPLGDWGTEAGIPDAPLAGSSYSANFNYVLPEKYDLVKGLTVRPEMIKLIAFVSYYHEVDTQRPVINAEETSLLSGSNSLVDQAELSNLINVYPNPASMKTTISFEQKNSGFSIVEIIDNQGKCIYTIDKQYLSQGHYDLEMNCSEFSRGIYYIRLIQPNGIMTSKLMIN